MPNTNSYPLIRTQNDSYTILPPYEMDTIQYDKKLVDTRLQAIIDALNNMHDVITKAQKDIPVITDYLCDAMECGTLLDDTHHALYARAANLLTKYTTHIKNANDTIPDRSTLITLEDLGFVRAFTSFLMYEKTVSDNNEKTIIEEIILAPDVTKVPALYRERTIEWAETHYGRTSTKITYRDLPIPKELEQAIRNCQ